jgi:alpha-L-fucosidase
MNDTWGFKKNDHNWKSAQVLIDNLVDIAAKGGNYLLNVGPTAEGLIPAASVERLQEMGKWLAVNKEGIYATNSRKQYKEGDVKFTLSNDGTITYAFVHTKPGADVTLESVKPAKGSKIHVLGWKQPCIWKEEGDKLMVKMPLTLPSEYVTTLRIKTK